MNQVLPQKMLEKFGYVQGTKDQATHYSTFGTVDKCEYRIINGESYYFDELSGMWRKSYLSIDRMTPIGEQEPNFRCGAVPKKVGKNTTVIGAKTEIYSKAKYKGD